VELLANLRQDQVGVLGSSPLVQVGPDDSIRTTVELMRAHRVGCALVSEGDRLVGLFSERDLLTRVLGGKVPPDQAIRTVMTPDPAVVGLQATVADVVRRMHAGGYRHLPVIGPDGNVRGMVSARAVVWFLVDHFPRAVHNQPPDPARVQTAREGA